jgi:hypothetical protein
MKALTHAVVIAVSSIVTAGLLLSQMCDFNCAFYGCSLSSPARISETAAPHAHCHRHKDDKSSQHNNSQQCTGHFDSIAVTAGASALSLHSIAHTDALFADPPLSFETARAKPRPQSSDAPDRSPPTYSVLLI